MMTGTELLPMRVLGSAWPRHFNKTVAEATWANIQKVGLPEWSEDDQTLARALQKELGNATQRGLSVKLAERTRRTGQGKPRRRLRRHRRHFLERADRHAALPVEHSRAARPQLGERHLDGHADRAQGRRPRAPRSRR